jgi:uncharacterized protein YjbI with pentapeptide repeats
MTEFKCKVAEVDIGYRSACKDLPEYQHTGYCVLHFPGEVKKDDFKKFVEVKCAQLDYNFRGTVFPEGTSDFFNFQFFADVYFSGAIFRGVANFARAQFLSSRWTDFSEAQFSGKETFFTGAQFSSESTDFRRTQFFSGRWTLFSEAQFSGDATDFSLAQFSGDATDFSSAQFSGERTDFSLAQFGSGETDFRQAAFTEKVFFRGATFKEKVAFWGTKENPVFGSRAWASFEGSRIDKPELLIFNTVLLHPGWLINTDVRKVNFTDVKWYGMPGGPEGTLDEEIGALKKRRVKSPHTLLAQACRKLSANAEENREYPLANEFHYWSMDVLRKESWDYLIWIRKWLRKNGLRVERRCGLVTTLRLVWGRIRRRRQSRPRSRFGLINTLYWALSGYGVRAARAFWVLIGMWAAFTTLYMIVDPSEFKDLGQGIGYLWQAAVYSLLAMARLNPEPTPEEPGLFQFLVGLEGILGPLQVALLALAIRRKVMR